MAQPIQTRLKLLFTKAKKDVTESLLPDLLGFSYEDKETNEADEISITLKDPAGKWAGTWKPEGGEVVRAYITRGTIAEGEKTLFCGTFYVDTLHVSGAPRVFELKAVSIPLNKPIRRKIKSKAWEKHTLKKIAEAIAADAGVKLLFDAPENPTYDRQDQQRESDLKFLSRLCEDAGLSLKLTDDKLVIFDQSYYESKNPVKTITLNSSAIVSWDFESAQSETYKSVTVSYRDPKQKKRGTAGGYKTSGTVEAKKDDNPAVMTYTYTDPAADENGQEYELKKRAKSIEEAKRLAKAKLRQLNLRSVTGSLTLVGDTSLVAGEVIAIKGFGSFDGNFIIETASHSIGNDGYTTGVSLRRVKGVDYAII